MRKDGDDDEEESSDVVMQCCTAVAFGDTAHVSFQEEGGESDAEREPERDLEVTYVM